MTARPIKAIDELNRGSLLDTKENRNLTHTEILQSMIQLLASTEDFILIQVEFKNRY